jgi:hypothetical protein
LIELIEADLLLCLSAPAITHSRDKSKLINSSPANAKPIVCR